MTRIFLTGYMGAGKTTLGKAFAREEQLSFIDLDWYIEERFHRSISQLFTERGEEGFRRVEQQMLHEVGAFEDVIISTGGGTPCFFDNMAYMNSVGTTVWLDASIEVLFYRLRIARNQRPILHGKNDEELRSFIVSSLEARAPFYTQAAHRFPADRLANYRQIAESVQTLKQMLTATATECPI